MLLQVLSVVVIALGVGLLVAANRAADERQRMQSHGGTNSANRISTSTRWEYERASQTLTMMVGLWAGCLTLGCLGLIIPWTNALIYWRRRPTPTGTPVGEGGIMQPPESGFMS